VIVVVLAVASGAALPLRRALGRRIIDCRNSVKFGPKRPITLALTVGADGIVKGEVIDQGDGEQAKIEMVPEPTVEGGWGLHLLDQVAAGWGVREGSTHVWFEIGPHRRRISD
jgi:hypothetical protein